MTALHNNIWVDRIIEKRFCGPDLARNSAEHVTEPLGEPPGQSLNLCWLWETRHTSAARRL